MGVPRGLNGADCFERSKVMLDEAVVDGLRTHLQAVRMLSIVLPLVLYFSENGAVDEHELCVALKLIAEVPVYKSLLPLRNAVGVRTLL